jgi:hypothetical protein
LPKRNALKEEAPATSGAPTDQGFPQRETGMDQGTAPEANIIGLLGKKRKPRPKDTLAGLATHSMPSLSGLSGGGGNGCVTTAA